MENETTEQKPVDAYDSWLTFDTQFDAKGLKKYDDLAALMPVGSSKGSLTKPDAYKLSEALQRKNGPRTTTIMKDGDLFRVQNVAQRVEKARKPKTSAIAKKQAEKTKAAKNA